MLNPIDSDELTVQVAMDRCEEQAASFDCAALLAMLQDLYAADESNRAFFHARFCLSEDPLQPYKKTIDRSLWSDIFRGQRAFVSKAKRVITECKDAIGNPEGLAELMVFYCERTAGFCADVFHTDPAYFDALVRMFAQALKTMFALPTNVQTSLLSRLDRVRSIGGQLGYGVGEDMDVLRAGFDSSFQAREVLHGNRNR